MTGVAPGGAGIHIVGREGVKAKRRGVGVDVLGDRLEAGEVLQLVHAVPRLLDEVGIDDDAVALEAVADGDQLAAVVIQVVGVGVELLGDRRAGQVERVVAPVLDGVGVADDEQGRRRALIHLGGQGLAVGAGGGGDDLDVDAGLVLVERGELLQRVVGLGLEVQPIDAARRGGGLVRRSGVFRRGVVPAAAGDERERHHKRKGQCQDLFHNHSSPSTSEYYIKCRDDILYRPELQAVCNIPYNCVYFTKYTPCPSTVLQQVRPFG